MKQELEALKKEVNDKHIEALAKIEALEKGLGKTEFEVGKWYRIHYTGQHCNGLPYERNPFYIVRYIESAHENTRCIFNLSCGTKVMMACDENTDWLERLATEEEIKTHLIAEAKRRGFKEGVKFKSLYDDRVREFDGGFDYFPNYNDLGEDCLFDSKWLLYKAGKWATILEQDPVIKIGGYVVHFFSDAGLKYPDRHYVTIDGNKFSLKFWEAAKLISEHSKAKIMIGCSKQYDVSLETINQILSRLK